MPDLSIPEPALVVLVGPSGAGKSTWAASHFRPEEVVSSDRLRAIVGSGEGDQDASADAFAVLDTVVTARGVVNLSSLLDYVLAGFLATGAISALGFAQQLYLLPISLFGMSVAASELSELSRRREGNAVIAGRVQAALGRIAFLLVPSTIALKRVKSGTA